VQTTWAKVYKNRGTITDDNPSSYLFTSLQNGITNHWKNFAVSRTSPVAELGVLDGTMEDSYATIDTRQSLLPAINNLTPEHQRQIGYLLGDVPTRDVQEKENLPKGTVLTRRYRALAALRKELGEI
jgi:DNA-directed RNA polymerase specialized sigma24 family protein